MRSKTLIDKMYQLGVCLSYDRVDDVVNGLATSVCNTFKETGMVYPLSLKHRLFTVGAIDNIDHNP